MPTHPRPHPASPAHSRSVLGNGLRVVTIEAPHLRTAMLAVYVRAGSRHEAPGINGVSHFLEHIFFRGCQRFPDGRLLNARVEDVGGNLNGVTTRDHGYYYTPIHGDHVEVGLETLGAMLREPLLKEVDIEREVILEEMLDEVDEDGRDIDVDNLAKRAAWGDHPLGFKIAGTTDTVRAITRDDLERHHRRFYGARNLVLCAAGPVRHDDVLRMAERHFGAYEPGELALDAPPPTWPQGPVLHFTEHDESQLEWRVSVPVPPEDHPDFPALMVLRRIIDDGLSSRLQVNVVDRRGLAYAVQAGLETYSDVGTFDVDVACAPNKASEALAEVLRTLGALAHEGADADEVARARVRHRIGLEFTLDSSADLAGWFGGTELFRPPETFEQRIAQVDAVTGDDVRRVARDIFRADRLLVTAVGRLDRTEHHAFERIVHDAPGFVR